MNGKNVTITYGGRVIALCTSQRLHFAAEVEEVPVPVGGSHADWAVYRPNGGASWSIDNEGLYSAGDDIFGLVNQYERLQAVVSAGALTITGNVVLGGLNVVAEVDALAKMSAQMAGDDLPTVEVSQN